MSIAEDIRERWREAINRGSKARDELPLVKEDLERGQEMACRTICACVREASSGKTIDELVGKLWVAACRLEAIRGVADDLVNGIENAKIALRESRNEATGG